MGPHPSTQARSEALDLSGVHRVPDWDAEGAARDGMTSIVNVDVVVARREGDVLHTAAAVFVVLAGDFGL